MIRTQCRTELNGSETTASGRPAGGSSRAVATGATVRAPGHRARALPTALAGGATPGETGRTTRGAGPATVVARPAGLAGAARHARPTDIVGAGLTREGTGAAADRAATHIGDRAAVGASGTGAVGAATDVDRPPTATGLGRGAVAALDGFAAPVRNLPAVRALRLAGGRRAATQTGEARIAATAGRSAGASAACTGHRVATATRAQLGRITGRTTGRPTAAPAVIDRAIGHGGAAEDGAVQVGVIGDGRPVQVGINQAGPTEIGRGQVGAAEVRPAQVGAADVAAGAVEARGSGIAGQVALADVAPFFGMQAPARQQTSAWALVRCWSLPLPFLSFSLPRSLPLPLCWSFPCPLSFLRWGCVPRAAASRGRRRPGAGRPPRAGPPAERAPHAAGRGRPGRATDDQSVLDPWTTSLREPRESGGGGQLPVRWSPSSSVDAQIPQVAVCAGYGSGASIESRISGVTWQHASGPHAAQGARAPAWGTRPPGRTCPVRHRGAGDQERLRVGWIIATNLPGETNTRGARRGGGAANAHLRPIEAGTANGCDGGGGLPALGSYQSFWRWPFARSSRGGRNAGSGAGDARN